MDVGKHPAWRCLCQYFRESGQLQSGCVCNGAIQLAQKRIAVIGIVFPRIFSIENNRHYPASGRMLPDILQAADEIGDSAFGLPLGVGEADQVGEGVVTEKESDFLAPPMEDVGLVERFPSGPQPSQAS